MLLTIDLCDFPQRSNYDQQNFGKFCRIFLGMSSTQLPAMDWQAVCIDQPKHSLLCSGEGRREGDRGGGGGGGVWSHNFYFIVFSLSFPFPFFFFRRRFPSGCAVSTTSDPVDEQVSFTPMCLVLFCPIPNILPSCPPPPPPLSLSLSLSLLHTHTHTLQLLTLSTLPMSPRGQNSWQGLLLLPHGGRHSLFFFFFFFLTHRVFAARSTLRLFKSLGKDQRQELSSCFVVACCHSYCTSQCSDLAQLAPTSKSAEYWLQDR